MDLTFSDVIVMSLYRNKYYNHSLRVINQEREARLAPLKRK